MTAFMYLMYFTYCKPGSGRNNLSKQFDSITNHLCVPCITIFSDVHNVVYATDPTVSPLYTTLILSSYILWLHVHVADMLCYFLLCCRSSWASGPVADQAPPRVIFDWQLLCSAHQRRHWRFLLATREGKQWCSDEGSGKVMSATESHFIALVNQASTV